MMNRDGHKQEITGALERLIALNAEHEWTVDELRDSLRLMGIDPERLLNQVKERTDTYINQGNPPDQRVEEGDEQDDLQPGASPLGILCEMTDLSSPEVADQLGVTVEFMLDLEQHSTVIPPTWPPEMARRASKKLPGASEQKVLRAYRRQRQLAYEQQRQLAKAASRSADYSKTKMTVEMILRRSGMSAEAQQFWRALAEEERS